MSDCPAKTDVSEEMSKSLKKRGFRFVGPTIMYAFMQAMGMVNDHTIDCSFRCVDGSVVSKKTSAEKKRKLDDQNDRSSSRKKK
jgi:hypothetical protein